MPAEDPKLMDLTTEIVSAYVANNSLPGDQLSGLIQQVYHTVATLSRPEQPEEPRLQPAVPVKRSVKPNEIVCLECGKGQKMLKRHLITAHGLSPDEYRAKWNLGADYPLVAPNYAKLRSQFAKEIGLGRRKQASGRSNGSRRRGGRAAASASE